MAPEIGAAWRPVAGAQAVAAARQVDGLLSHASGDDRFQLLILRFATAAIAGTAVMPWAV